MPTQTSNAPEIPCFQEISGTFLYQSRKGLRKDLPCGGTNDEGETVIIEHEKNDGDPRFHLTTVQNNGWLRHNYIYEDGSREELFEK